MPAASFEESLLKLLMGLARNLRRYQAMDRRFREKYQITF